MISIEEARKHIINDNYTDEEVESILTSLYLLSEVLINMAFYEEED